MKPSDFLNTIYLGDRACKGIVIDSRKKEVKILVDCISRVRGPTWNYYVAEDLEGRSIVLLGVNKISWPPTDGLPNDEIRHCQVKDDSSSLGSYIFEFEIGAVRDDGQYSWMTITIEAEGVCLEDSLGKRYFD
jgi:hypothetical protein